MRDNERISLEFMEEIERLLGRVFLGGCILAGMLGIFLGSTLYLPGSRIP